MQCEIVMKIIPGLLDYQEVPNGIKSHVSECSGCFLELEKYRAIASSLAELESSRVAEPKDLLFEILNQERDFNSSNVIHVDFSSKPKSKLIKKVSSYMVFASAGIGAAVYLKKIAQKRKLVI